MKITVIDNYDSFVYNLVRYLEEESSAEITVMRNDRISYREIDSSDAILLSPGPGIPSEAGDLLKVIERYKNVKPILGVCLGHQAIGEVFGAKLVQCSKPYHGEEDTINIIKNGIIFNGIPSFTEVGRYHSWKLNISNGSSLKTLALSSDNEVMAFEHKSLPLIGIQFHPESILTPNGRKMIKNWVKFIQTNNKNRKNERNFT